jgi:peptide deformylase
MILATLLITFAMHSDPLLKEETLDICPCHIQDESTQKKVFTLMNMLDIHNLKSISAPEISIRDSIVIVDLKNEGKKEFINPEILSTSEDMCFEYETCVCDLSDTKLIPRSKQIVVKFYDRFGNIFVEEYFDDDARQLQHQIDHLDGIDLNDRILHKIP